MVIPEERDGDFERKMKSPLFREHFEGENWSLLYFDAFRQAFTRAKAAANVEALLGRKLDAPSRGGRSTVRENQTFMDFGPEGAAADAVAPSPS
jgi:hypothetical protein